MENNKEDEKVELEKKESIDISETEEIKKDTDEGCENNENNEEIAQVVETENSIEIKEEKTIIEEKRKGFLENFKKKKVLEKAPNSKEETKSKKIRIAIYVSAVIFALFILFAVIVCINKLNDKVYKNIYLNGEDLSGKTKEEVENIIVKENEKLASKKIAIYQNTDEIFNVTSEEIELKIDEAKTIEKIMGFGRKENLFVNNFKIISALFSSVNIEAEYTYSEEKIDGVIKNIDLSINNRVVDDSYSIDEQNQKLIITIGKSGNSIDYDIEKENLITAFKSLNETKLTLDLISRGAQKIDVEKIYEEVKREPKDAYVEENTSPIKFVSEVVGIDFDKNELKEFLDKDENKEEGKVLEFPLKVTEPNVKLKDLTNKYYNDKIAGKTTYFNAGQYARANNLRVALSYLNDIVIMPGETFSYNDAIGDTTAAKGYMAAATFKGGTTVNEMGGGICQTTSTLYDVVLMAGLEIVERHQHGLPVGYVQPSLDATVYSPVLDFKFKNTRNYPIKIVTSYSSGGSLNVSIYGTKESDEYDIVLSSNVISEIPFTTKYTYDNNLDEGEQVVDVNGVNGYVSEGYLTRYKNGAYVDSRMLSRDTYNAQQQVVRVGTRKAAS